MDRSREWLGRSGTLAPVSESYRRQGWDKWACSVNVQANYRADFGKAPILLGDRVAVIYA